MRNISTFLLINKRSDQFNFFLIYDYSIKSVNAPGKLSLTNLKKLPYTIDLVEPDVQFKLSATAKVELTQFSTLLIHVQTLSSIN